MNLWDILILAAVAAAVLLALFRMRKRGGGCGCGCDGCRADCGKSQKNRKKTLSSGGILQ